MDQKDSSTIFQQNSNNNNSFQKFSKNSKKFGEKDIKILEKSEQFFYEVISKNEKLNFIISLSLIEEKNNKQRIIISANPYALKNNNINKKEKNKDFYIEEIKKAFTKVTYKEKFSLNDFKENSDFYAKEKNINLKKIFNDIITSIKMNKSRIKINKYHMIFNYYINNDKSDWNNSIILCLDNEIESSILEKYYENTFKKIYKAKNENNNNINSNNIYNSTDPDVHNIMNESLSYSNSINNSNKKIEISEYDYNDNNNIINNKENINHSESENNSDININNNKESKKNKQNININNINNNNVNSNIRKGSSKKRSHKNTSLIQSQGKEKEKEISKTKKAKSKSKGNNAIMSKEKKNQTTKSPSKEEKDIITKKFLYSEYKFSNYGFNSYNEYNDNNIEKNEKNKNKINEENNDNDFIDSDDESWGESLFCDNNDNNVNNSKNEENKNLEEKNKNVNLLGNKTCRNKTPEKEKNKDKDKEKDKNVKIFQNNNNINNQQIDLPLPEQEEDNNNNIQNNDETSVITLSEEEEENEQEKTLNNENLNLEKNNEQKEKEKEAQNQRQNQVLENLQTISILMPEKSMILDSALEIKLIKEKIEPYNKLIFKLVYSSQKDKDDYDSFKNSVIDNFRHLILIKTQKNKKFGIYFNEKLFSSKGKQNQETIDMMGFIYSFQNKKFFCPKERIVCFTQSPQMPYLFKLSDHSIYIKNNFLNEKHYLMQSSKVFWVDNLFQELNDGENEFNISLLEIYRAEIPE